jgi:RHS repeat-associated protein
MSEVEGGDYELAKVVESGTQQVLIPAIKDMGQTLEKVSSSVGTGADRVADTALEADATAAQGLHDAENGLNGTPGEGGVHPTESTNTSGGGGQSPRTNTAGTPKDDFNGGNEGGQGSEGDDETPACKDPVDPVSGQLMTATADVDLPGVLRLVLRRAYASGYRHGRLHGPGWSCTLDQRLVIDADGIHFLGDDAQILNYAVPTQPGQVVLPAAGARWPLTWDRQTDAIAILDPATGTTRHFTAIDDGGPRWLTGITDRNANWLTITRDADGVPTEVDHVGGYRIAVDSSFRADGFRIDGLRLLDAEHPDGVPLAGYGYDPLGRLTEIRNADGAPLIYEYDSAHRITAWIDRLGYRYEYAYDDEGRIARVGGEDGAVSAVFAYDRAARTTQVTDGLGAVTEYRYDAHNHLTGIVDALGNATLLSHDRFGKLTRHVDPLGNTTAFVRDAVGNVVELERADGSRVRTEYNDLQLPVRIAASGGAETVFEYDERGNLLASIDTQRAVTRYAYSDHGALIQHTDALGHSSTLAVNAAGLPTGLADPLGSRWELRHDGLGRVTAVTDPLGVTVSTEWGPAGALARTHPDGSTERWAYDAAGNLTAYTDQAGATTAFEYGPFGTIVARTEPDGTRFTFEHDTELRMTKAVNPQQASWTYEYDSTGNLVAESDFNRRTVSYRHDAAGRIVRRTNGAGESIEFVRDMRGRVIEQRAGTETATFEYDDAGRLTRMANGDGEFSLVRDARGQVIAETFNGNSLSNAFDALGQRVSRATPSGRETSWEYDAAGRAVSMSAGERRLSFGHDELGRETFRWFGDHTALTSEWDLLGRLTTRRLLGVEGTGQARTSRILSERSWTYRADGNPESVTDTADGTRRLTLDVLGRVTAVSAATWSEQYAYDSTGNPTHATDTRAADSGTAGEREISGTLLHRAGRTRYEYDGQGRVVRRVRRTLSGGQRVWTFAYDALDRMTETVTPNGERWRYRYDPLGRRTAKQRLDPSDVVVEETLFFWDGAVLAEQHHRAGSAAEGVGAGPVRVTAWDYEPNSWAPVAQSGRTTSFADAPQEAVDEQFHAIVTDLVGTPTELVGTSGAVEWRRSAGLWGEQFASGGDGADCPLRFPGQYHDTETGLDYNLQRYYDPAVARYCSPDPLGLAPSPNPHGYVPNPLSWLDPFGLEDETPGQTPIPKVDNARLQNFIDRLYKGIGSPNQIGDGTAMAAANHEATGGAQVEGSDHVVKLNEVLRGIDNTLNADQLKIKSKWTPNPKTPHDIAVANGLKRAINDALAGQYEGYQNYPELNCPK